MAKPVKQPQWDSNQTNSVEPVTGRKTDGWTTNDVPSSANLNFLLYWIWQWIVWVDAGVWTAVSLVLTGTLSSRGITSVGIDDDDHGTAATPGGTFTGGNGIGSGPNGAAGAVLTGGNADEGGAAGSAVVATGGASGPALGELGAPAVTATGGLNQDGTHAAALKAVHGDVDIADGSIVQTGAGTTGANEFLASNFVGNVNVSSGVLNPLGGIAIQAVQVPTLLSTWANFGGSNQTAGYWKSPFGEVQLQGAVAGGSSAVAIFTLPVGYRPAKQLNFPVDAPGVTSGLANILINTNGDVLPGFTGGALTFLDLGPVRFRV